MQYKTYLIGDSHATDFYIAFKDKFSSVEWKTILSPGFQRLNRVNNRSANFDVDQIWKIFESLEKNSRVILSCTDIDSRQGANTFERFLQEDYIEVFTKINQIIQSNDIIVLDWFSIKNDTVTEQCTTVKQRVEIRKKIIGILELLKNKSLIKDYHTTHMNSTIDDENGLCKDNSILRDGVHYDLTNQTILDILIPTFEKFINEERI
jgi:hypothetical protein